MPITKAEEKEAIKMAKEMKKELLDKVKRAIHPTKYYDVDKEDGPEYLGDISYCLGVCAEIIAKDWTNALEGIKHSDWFHEKLENLIRNAVMEVDEDVKCYKHSNYKAIQKPRVNCEQCWSYYFEQRKNESK